MLLTLLQHNGIDRTEITILILQRSKRERAVMINIVVPLDVAWCWVWQLI